MIITPELDALASAYQIANKSRDPRTQVGAVVEWHQQLIGEGWNRFASPALESPERWADKGRYVLHAEYVAVTTALMCLGSRTLMEHAVLVAPWYACEQCALTIIDSGIKRVVGHGNLRDFIERTDPSWSSNLSRAWCVMREAGVSTEWVWGPVQALPIRAAGGYFNPAHPRTEVAA